MNLSFDIFATSPSSKKINLLSSLPTARGSDAATILSAPIPIKSGDLLLAKYIESLLSVLLKMLKLGTIAVLGHMQE